MDERRSVGKEGEDAAVGYLEGKGYRIIERNFRFDRGEIDIVARDGDELVFVEVKTRRSFLYGDPEDALTPRKCRQIYKVADGYLAIRRLGEPLRRFDIIAIEQSGDELVIRHLVDAF